MGQKFGLIRLQNEGANVKAKKLTLELALSEVELCLKFANTADWHASEKPVESLNQYDDLLHWSSERGLIGENQARQLGAIALRQPPAARDVLRRAVALREAIYRIFSSYAASETYSQGDLALLNDELGPAMAKLLVAGQATGFEMGWAEEPALDMMIWPVLRSAARLLTSKEILNRVGECADDRGCGMLFIDMSKNHSRRWCDINDCGNRAKQRRHVARRRGKGIA